MILDLIDEARERRAEQKAAREEQRQRAEERMRRHKFLEEHNLTPQDYWVQKDPECLVQQLKRKMAMNAARSTPKAVARPPLLAEETLQPDD